MILKLRSFILSAFCLTFLCAGLLPGMSFAQSSAKSDHLKDGPWTPGHGMN
jgi:hypothetical protein